jgi:hypothetical protein
LKGTKFRKVSKEILILYEVFKLIFRECYKPNSCYQ